jgi:hypothetical protein
LIKDYGLEQCAKENFMKTRTIFYIIFLLFIMSCSQIKKINNATLYDYEYDTKTELNEKQLLQLEELIKNGLTLTTDVAKWTVLQSIEFSYSDKKNENIIVLHEGKEGYYYIGINDKYYEVKTSYKDIFINLLKIGEVKE